MAKIQRILHKIFGDSGSSDNFAKFGSLVAGSPVKTKDILTIQSLPAWDDGWQSSIYGGNKDLLLQDLNAFSFEHSRQIGYLFQAGVSEWDASTTYYKGSIVQRTSGSDATGELYMSLIDTNIGNAVPVQADNANWRWLNSPQLPAGSLLDWSGLVAPTGFLRAIGQAVSRTTYASIFANSTITLAGNLTNGSPIVTGLASTTDLEAGHYMSGTGIASGAKILTVDGATQVTMDLNATSTQTPSAVTFAANPLGDGVTTFNLPDTRRRVTVGAGGTGNATLGAQAGAVGGSDTHTLTTAEIPAHTHSAGGVGASVTGPEGGGAPMGNGTTGSAGGGGAHNNIQQSIVMLKIIKT